ncbi:hypothetical protein [Halobellus rufus]|jgi:hypothetical protein|uniref:hypothetical protein n=1 Tax=Halobellus rufus TaxID=1448860 RepID=UPI00067903DA|nr:hypothetical protein [Halobellus rufus]
MTERTLRIERAVNELMNDLPADVASEDIVDEHMQRLVADYGLSVDRAQTATRQYLTTSREGVAEYLVTHLARTTETPPTRDAVVKDLEFLANWSVPLEDASAVVRRKYDPAAPADPDSAPDSATGVPTGATDAEVAAAIPSLDDHEWSSTPDRADPGPDDSDILDADSRETDDGTAAPTYRRIWRTRIVARLASTVRTARRRLAAHRL